MAGRGRPKIDDTPPPRQYTRVFKDAEGMVETWHYNLDKFANGPIKVDITYPTKYESFEDTNAKLPPTQRKYYNPSTEKYVGYGRAKQLGLI
jgi:hypothetical protein